MKYGYRYVERNKKPATGPDVLSLCQLRHYVRLFWTDRRYGVCHIPGGKAAFLRFCTPRLASYVSQRITPDKPSSEYFPADLQRLLSKKVHQVLRGQIIFVEVDAKTATWRPLLHAPEPPLEHFIPFHDHHFRIEHTAIGPKIRRL